MESDRLERLYLVCIHYSLKRPRDWDWIGKRLMVRDSVVPRLAGDLRYLRRVLSPRKDAAGQVWKGFAFIFLDPGWTSLLVESNPLHMAALGADLTAAQTQIERHLAQNDELLNAPPRRERIVTAGNLLYLLDLLDMAARGRGESFYRLFVGGAQTLRYDAPKVIEAAIRIANVGCGMPLFRFDDDVIFYGQRSPRIETIEGGRASRGRCYGTEHTAVVRALPRNFEFPLIRYSVYSGAYDAPLYEELDSCTDNEPRLLNGFAPRVVQLTRLPKRRNRQTEDTTQGVIQARVVKAFMKEIAELGANPFRQVVSGAGLCLSDGAILDLPPFSNMHLNVMWIDDHLKYALHDELGHFGRWTRTHHHYRARVSDARFTQLRHARRDGSPLFTYKDVKWHLQSTCCG